MPGRAREVGEIATVVVEVVNAVVDAVEEASKALRVRGLMIPRAGCCSSGVK